MTRRVVITGTGLLTAHLADIASEVIAVELDTRLKPILDAAIARLQQL